MRTYRIAGKKHPTMAMPIGQISSSGRRQPCSPFHHLLFAVSADCASCSPIFGGSGGKKNAETFFLPSLMRGLTKIGLVGHLFLFEMVGGGPALKKLSFATFPFSLRQLFVLRREKKRVFFCERAFKLLAVSWWWRVFLSQSLLSTTYFCSSSPLEIVHKPPRFCGERLGKPIPQPKRPDISAPSGSALIPGGTLPHTPPSKVGW